MWPSQSPAAHVADLAAVPDEARSYYVPAETGGFVLRDILDHLASVHTPESLKPVYQIRQYSHRRTAFLKRHLVPAEHERRLPRYPQRVEEYRAREDADTLHADVLYSPAGDLYEEFQEQWAAHREGVDSRAG